MDRPSLHALTERVPARDQAAMAAARARLDRLTKPQGSLGRLEELAIALAGITGQSMPRLPRKTVIVMAGDHGVATEGVSAFPQEVTAQMVGNFLAGGAAINVLARAAGARVIVVDIGVAGEVPSHPDLVARRIASGTGNMTLGPATTEAEALAAIAVGIEVVNGEVERGVDLLAMGDMGIANTTASSALIAAITDRPAAEVTGRGTGVDDAGLGRKIGAVERALAVNREAAGDPLALLAAVGGLEIAGLVGVILGAAAHRVPILLDGFISGAAALVATELCPAARDSLIAAHRSVEIGHRAALERMGLVPFLDLDLRLGEGSGAALLMPLVDGALAILAEMATFESAGVSERTELAAAGADER